MRRINITVLFLFAAVFMSPSLHADDATAPVEGFAQAFMVGNQISNAHITVNETGQTFTTRKNGYFGPFNYPIGKPITLTFSKWGYQTTQSATLIVPSDGLTGAYHNITFQVPNIAMFYALANIMHASIDTESCHLATTITQYHKTMDDVPQGVAGARLIISPTIDAKPFYFDIFRNGPLKNKTNPITRTLTETSDDGGVIVFNLPVRATPYIVTAEKPGVNFTKVMFLCQKDTFINLSPPQGPTEIKDI